MADSKYVTSEMYVPDAYVFLDAQPAYAIVVHKSASPNIATAEALAEYFQSGSAGRDVSSHYCVGKDGHIVQVVHEKDGAGANSAQPVEPNRNPLFNANINWNLRTISVEVVDTSVNNTDDLTLAQKDAVFALVKDIATRKAIDTSHIVQHHDLQPVTKPNCAGNFPMSELLSYVKGNASIMSGPVLNKLGEVIDIPDVSQFYPNKTEYACGFFASAMIAYGQNPNVAHDTATSSEIEAWALAKYVSVYGSDGANMTDGVSIANMHDLLLAALPNSGVSHYYDLPISSTSTQSSDLANIYGALDSGYPVVCTVTEVSIFDVALQANPYFWGASGNHVFVITGYNKNGDLLVHDPANVVGVLNGVNTVRAQPRTYDHTKIDISWASMAHMPWLEAWSTGWTPTNGVKLNQQIETDVNEIMASPLSNANQVDKNNLIVEIWSKAGRLIGAANVPVRTSKSFEVWRNDLIAGIVHGYPLEEEQSIKDEVGNDCTGMAFSSGQLLLIKKSDGTIRWV
jgi:uncharacterized protein YvpB